MSYSNFADAPFGDVGDGKLTEGVQLVRQPSVYSLTFDEFQNTMAGPGKDYGSMNMDELLRNIWTAEETQATTSSAGGGQGNVPGGNLRRQGSLTFPRTLSQRTVDEVWRDLIKECGDTKDGNGHAGSNVPQRQPTLGEVTLEEFLVRAGVAREDAQQFGKPNNNGLLSTFSQPSKDAGILIGFQQPNRTDGGLSNRVADGTTQVASQPLSFANNVGRVNSSQQLHQRQHQHQQPPLLPKPTPTAFTSPVQSANHAQISTPSPRGGMVRFTEPSVNTGLVQGRALQVGGLGIFNLPSTNVTVPTVSPIAKSSVMSPSSLSSVPHGFNSGRRNHTVEKVVERRMKRMIKNRESAARSRARKQAYTLELEAEVAKLKVVNEELQKKQEEITEMQKNQILESVNRLWGSRRNCLRRTLTGPW